MRTVRLSLAVACVAMLVPAPSALARPRPARRSEPRFLNYRGRTAQGLEVGLTVTSGGRLVAFSTVVRAPCVDPTGGDEPIPDFPVAVYLPYKWQHTGLPVKRGKFKFGPYQLPGNAQTFSFRGHVSAGGARGTLNGRTEGETISCQVKGVHFRAHRVR